MSDTKQYILSCHCQSHIYLLNLPHGALEEKGVVCDCSFCLKRRVVWAFVSGESMVLHKGGEGLEDYKFGSKTANHKHCGKCGTYLLMQHNRPDDDRHFINMRAIRNPDFDLWKLPLETWNEAITREPVYKEVTLPDIPGAEDALATKAAEMGQETETYVGSCHCQAVKFAVVCRPIGKAVEEEMSDCACSICLGNGALWVYPMPPQIIFHPPSPASPHKPLESSIIRYTFSDATYPNVHFMCKVCGCHVYEHREGKEGADVGLNVALFSRAGEWFRDVMGLKGEGMEQLENGARKGGKLLGLGRNVKDRESEPRYEVKL